MVKCKTEGDALSEVLLMAWFAAEFESVLLVLFSFWSCFLVVLFFGCHFVICIHPDHVRSFLGQ